MRDSKRRFRTVKFRFETKRGEVVLRHMLTDNLLPMLVPNQYVEMMSINKLGTGRNHANKLCVFFNYLHEYHGADYESASNRQVQSFLTFLIYGDHADLRITDPADSKCRRPPRGLSGMRRSPGTFLPVFSPFADRSGHS